MTSLMDNEEIEMGETTRLQNSSKKSNEPPIPFRPDPNETVDEEDKFKSPLDDEKELKDYSISRRGKKTKKLDYRQISNNNSLVIGWTIRSFQIFNSLFYILVSQSLT